MASPGGDRREQPLLRTLAGEVLRHRRVAQRRTLADVARAARVSVQYLSEVERGRKEASSEVLAAVCEALELDLADFLTEVRLRLIAQTARTDQTTRTVQVAPPRRLPVTRLAPRTRRPGDAVLLAA